jgi:hypothetical protein
MSTHIADVAHIAADAACLRYASSGAGAAPQTVTLELPSVEQPLRYAMAYWHGACASLLGPQRLRSDVRQRYSATVDIGPRLVQRWHHLFGDSADAARPYLCNQSVGTLLYLRLFRDLGINLRHLLHLRHATVHSAGPAALAAAPRQRLVCGVKRLLRMGEDKALVELQTVVQDDSGRELAVVEDSFLVRQLPRADLASLPGDRGVMRDLLGLRHRQPQLLLSEPGTATRWLKLPRGLGRAYGRISGDMNPVHTSPWLARLFGCRRSFLQGLGVRHLVLRHLAEMGLPLQRLSMTFASPALLGSTLALVVQDGRYELRESGGRLVAYGEGG